MKIKHPSGFLYFIAYIIFYPLLKIFFRLEINRDFLNMPKGAFLLLSNHITMLDFLLVMLPLYPKRRLNAVAAQKWYLYKPLNKILPAGGGIPKNMFDPDMRAIVGIKTVLKRGGCVLLFPEGRCSSSMAYTGMHKSTGKLIQKLKTPVITALIEGGDVCLPHWRKGFRLGKIRVTYRNLFSGDELAALSVAEINAAVDARLSGIEGAVPVRKPFQTLSRKRLADGLARILYYCPKCESEFTLKTSDNTISCSSCGFFATVDRQGLLTYSDGSAEKEHISVWFGKQVRHEMRSLSVDMKPIVDSVSVSTPASVLGDGIVHSGNGTMTIDPSGWRFEGVLHGKETCLFFPVDSVPAMSYDHQNNYQIYYGGDYYMFMPSDPQKCIKYVILAECLHSKFASEPLLTVGVNSGLVD